MSNEEQIKALADDLDNLFNRYKQEFNMTFADILGILHMKTHLICHEAIEQQDLDYIEAMEDEEGEEWAEPKDDEMEI